MILRLTSEVPLDRALIGGKACGLVRLLRAGFDVPDAWCLPTTAYRQSTDGLPEDVVTALGRLWSSFASSDPSGALAVRSSAVAEDLGDASFAGLYATRLGVDSEVGLCDAVADCWRAVESAPVRAYRGHLGIADRPATAVVIQQMVRAEVAGVLLTVNPMRPFASEISVDSAWGLGEAVVSGQVEPDHLILDRETGAVREERVGEKALRIDWQPGRGPVTTAVPAELRARRSLTAVQLRRLAEMARRIEGAFGPRQDFEWAFEGGRLLALQLRPVTHLPPLSPDAVWSRKFGDEYLAGYTTPLTQTLLVPWIVEDFFADMARLMKREDLVALAPLQRYHGYQYLSGEYMARLLGALPRRVRAMHTQGWFTPQWQRRIAEQRFDLRATANMVLAPLRDQRGRIDRNLCALEQHCQRIEREVGLLLDQDYEALGDGAFRAQLAAARELGREHFRVIRWGMGFYNPVLHAGLRACLARWAGDSDARLYQDLVSGLPGTHTSAINREIWGLASAAGREPDLCRELMAGEAYARLRATTPGAAFWPAFDGFLARYGHRGGTREICEPRWGEAPDIVLGFVRAQLRGSEPTADPRLAEARAASRRSSADKEIARRVGRGPGGRLRLAVISALARYAQAYTRYRENQRHFLDLLTAHIRRLVLARGAVLAAAGVLAEPGDVFFLRVEELVRLRPERTASPDLRAEIEQRRQHFQTWRDRLPATYLFDGIETEGEVAEGDPANPGDRGSAPGVGVSRGVGRGPARIVRDMRDLGAVTAGEVLVTSNIDPGWTHVFPLLAGLVTETGGMLSHGALLSREYGIPAVMGVPRVTERARNGKIVEVDGTRGRVWLEGRG